MNDIDSSNEKYTNESNDKYSNVKYTNDSILTHILLFGKVYICKHSHTCCSNEIYHIKEQISKKFLFSIL